MLTFAELRAANETRVNRWHKSGLDEWSPNDWMTALVGEIGEAANVLKKLKRIEDEMPNISERSREVKSREDAMALLGPELADTMIYLDLLANRLGINLEEHVRSKFNAVSIKYGFPERL